MSASQKLRRGKRHRVETPLPPPSSPSFQKIEPAAGGSISGNVYKPPHPLLLPELLLDVLEQHFHDTHTLFAAVQVHPLWLRCGISVLWRSSNDVHLARVRAPRRQMYADQVERLQVFFARAFLERLRFPRLRHVSISVVDKQGLAHTRIPRWLPATVTSVGFQPGNDLYVDNLLGVWAQRTNLTALAIRNCSGITVKLLQAVARQLPHGPLPFRQLQSLDARVASAAVPLLAAGAPPTLATLRLLVTDSGQPVLPALAALTQLTTLDVAWYEDAVLTNQELVGLRWLAQLRELCLWGDGDEYDGSVVEAEHFRLADLRRLLARLPQLRRLKWGVENWRMSPRALRTVGRCCPQLRVLDMDGSFGLQALDSDGGSASSYGSGTLALQQQQQQQMGAPVFPHLEKLRFGALEIRLDASLYPPLASNKSSHTKTFSRAAIIKDVLRRHAPRLTSLRIDSDTPLNRRLQDWVNRPHASGGIAGVSASDADDVDEDGEWQNDDLASTDSQGYSDNRSPETSEDAGSSADDGEEDEHMDVDEFEDVNDDDADFGGEGPDADDGDEWLTDYEADGDDGQDAGKSDS